MNPTANPGTTRSRARTWLVVALVVAAIIGAFAFRAISERREEDRQIDGYYCTLGGVGPLHRAPRTGERCVDIIEKGY